MKKQFIALRFTAIVMLLLFAANLLAQTHSLSDINAPIKRVTVYLNGAQVWRSTNVSVQSGKTDITFTGISPYMDESSLQVKSENSNCVVMAVSSRKNFMLQKKQLADIELLKQNKEKIALQITDEEAQKNIYQRVLAILNDNIKVSGANTGLNTAELKNNVAYQETKMAETYPKLRDTEIKLAKLKNELANINKQLEGVNNQTNTVTSDVIVTLYSTVATETMLELTYRTDRAAWFAAYDLRVKDISQPIVLQYRAFIQQRSNENWDNVQLSLSTGNPEQNQVKPNLDTWFLRYANTPQQTANSNVTIINQVITQVKGNVVDAQTGESIPFATVMATGTTVGTTTDFDGLFTLQIPPNTNTITISSVGYKPKTVNLLETGNIKLEMETSLLEVATIASYKKPIIPKETLESITANAAGVYALSESGEKPKKQISATQNVAHTEQKYQTGITYIIEKPYTILSDGKAIGVDIKTYSIPAEYEYYCAPKLNEQVFLTALIPEWQNLKIPDGELSLFFEDTYVGKSLLNTQQTSDTLSLSLGIDKDIVVSRQKQTELRNRQFMGSHKIDTRAFEIKIRNLKSQTIRLTIEDQIPISTDKDIEVKDTQYDDADYNDINGKVTWKLNLSPNQEKKLPLKYSVKYPKNKTLVLE